MCGLCLFKCLCRARLQCQTLLHTTSPLASPLACSETGHSTLHDTHHHTTSSNVSAVSDCGVRLSCMRPLLSLAMRLAIPHCMTLIMYGTWHGTPHCACMCQGTHTLVNLCGTATSSLTCDETVHSTLHDTHHAWHIGMAHLAMHACVRALITILHCVGIISHGTWHCTPQCACMCQVTHRTC